MSDFDWVILLPVIAMGVCGLALEGKLNFRGVIIDPLKSMLSLLKPDKH